MPLHAERNPNATFPHGSFFATQGCDVVLADGFWGFVIFAIACGAAVIDELFGWLLYGLGQHAVGARYAGRGK